TGAALAFTLIQKPAPRRSGGSVASAQASSETPTAASSESSGGEYAGDLGAIWEEATISDSGWREVITQSQRERRRLTAPPKDFRNRPSYARLRALVLSDDAARGGFLSIRWRGRPAGLPLVAQLLSEGTLSPEVSTDHEYLEAELGELAGVDARKRAALTSWQLPGWSIVREGNPGQGLKYTAQREATTAPPP
ncbi:MAG TPA: hypothetical protein VJS68_02470, partial [Thermoplasmata archaeon]|nr:hypothetical protein [Thermoplasmata archaeon]